MEFVKLADERKNMLLHIFVWKRRRRRSGRRKMHQDGKSRERSARRVEDIIGKASAVAERMPFMPQTVLLRPEVSPAYKSTSAGRGSKDRSGVSRRWVRPRRNRKERSAFGGARRGERLLKKCETFLPVSAAKKRLCA